MPTLTRGLIRPRIPTRRVARYVRWWAKNIDSRALKEISDDPHNHHGPADHKDYPSSVLAGAFIASLRRPQFQLTTRR